MGAAVIYARISKDAAGESLGVDRQERACRELAARRGVDVADVLIDNDISAYRGKRRPAFERLVDLLRSGDVDTVLALHPDRLYRRATDLERLVEIVEATKAQVLTVSAGDVDLSTATGRMTARIVGSIAQGESERIGERIKLKMDELARAGRPSGGRPPYGYSWGTVDGRRTLVHNPSEATVVRRIAREALEGRSMLAIARTLTAEGIPTREGRAWAHSTVRAVVVNPAAAGLRVHRREVAGPGDWQPILDRATWEDVRAVVADPARKRTRPPRRYLLTGLVENNIGEKMISRPGRGAGGGYDRRQYVTPTPCKACISIGADDLERFVVVAVLRVLDGADLPTPEADNAAGEEVAAIENEMREMAALRGAGTISLEEWLAMREPLQRRLNDAKARASTSRHATPIQKLMARRGAVRKAWESDELDLDQQRQVIAAAVDRIVIGPATRGRWTPLDDRVDIEWRI